MVGHFKFWVVSRFVSFPAVPIAFGTLIEDVDFAYNAKQKICMAEDNFFHQL